MDTFIEDLIKYNSWANQQIIAILSADHEKVSDRCLDLMSHILNVHHIWNGNIRQSPISYGPWELQHLAKLSEIDNSNTAMTLQILKETDASRSVKYQTKTGVTFVHSVQEIILQIITHSTYHRGQLATEFRNIGIAPPLTDYIYYKMTS
jgi:uncharacterized damage-inducible protein DinB